MNGKRSSLGIARCSMVCVSLMKRRRRGRETNREYPIKSACTHSSPLAGLSEEAFQLGGVVLISLLSSYPGCCCRFPHGIRGSLGLTDSSLNTDDLSCLGGDTKMMVAYCIPWFQGNKTN